MCNSYNLCNDLECIKCFNKSFMSHEKHIYIKNKILNDAKHITKSSGKKIEFSCNICKHDFTSVIANITRLNRWCPYCSNQKLCGSNNCNECFAKSFASSDKIKYIVDNEINPRQIFLKGDTDIKFKCQNCGHDFTTIARNVSVLNSWCPYCCFPPLKLCNNNCEKCFENSFASHKKSIFMSNKNTLTARQIFKNSHQKVIFNCDKCKNEFESVVKNITRNNIWCPYCILKTEKILLDFLRDIYQNIITQFSPTWSKNKKTNKNLRFDFLLTDLKLIIELDGPQHFIQISNWKSPEETQKIDVYKMKKAMENEYSIIRILQEDILSNKINWKQILINCIKPRLYPSVIYINSNDEYKNHKKLFNDFV